MKRFMIFITVMGMSFVFSTSPAWADHVAFASATGSQEIAGDNFDGVDTDATCQLFLELVPMTEVRYKLECFNITGVSQAHIHMGRAKTNGPNVAFLFDARDSGSTGDVNGLLRSGDGTAVSEGALTGADLIGELAGEDIGALMNIIRGDNAYLNVHTDANGGGEVRGQIAARVNDPLVVNELFTASATGSQEIAGDDPNLEGVVTDATCFAAFRVVGAGDDGLKYKLKCWNITSVTQAHIHMGSAAVNGPNVVFLFDARTAQTGDANGLLRAADGSAKSKGTLRSEDLIGELSGEPISALVNLLRNDNAYINVHTEANGPGEVRGQISRVDAIGF